MAYFYVLTVCYYNESNFDFSPKCYDFIFKIICVKFHEPTKFSTNTNLKLLIALRIIYEIYFASTAAQADLTVLFIKIVMI